MSKNQSSLIPLMIITVLVSAIFLLQGKIISITTTTPGSNRLIYAFSTAPRTLDPVYLTDENSAVIINNIYEGLVRFKKDSVEVEPCLAERWSVSPDAREWTFYLRRGVTFHDGTPFDARAVKLSYERQSTLLGRGTYTDLVFGPVEKLLVLDSHTVRFILKYPYAPFLNNLALPMAAPIVSPAAIEKYGTDLWQHPVGTGPFRFIRWDKNEIVVEPYPDYWGPVPRIGEIVFTSIIDPELRVKKLLRGEIDIADKLTVTQLKRYKTGQLKIFQWPGLDLSWLGFYLDKEPFSNPKLRLAIKLAINREELVKDLYPGSAVIATGILPPGVLGRPESNDAPSDPELARKLVREAGYPDGLKVTLITYTSPRPYNPAGGYRLAQALSRQLEEVGIAVYIKAFSWEEFKETLTRQEGDAFLYGWTSDNGDPDNFFYPLLSSAQVENKLNICHYRNRTLDALLLSAQKTTDKETRKHIYQQVQEIVDRDNPLITLNHSLNTLATTLQIQNFTPHPTGWHALREVIKASP